MIERVRLDSLSRVGRGCRAPVLSWGILNAAGFRLLFPVFFLRRTRARPCMRQPYIYLFYYLVDGNGNEVNRLAYSLSLHQPKQVVNNAMSLFNAGSVQASIIYSLSA